MPDSRILIRRIATVSVVSSVVAWRAAAGQTVAEYTKRADSLVRLWKAQARDRVPEDTVTRPQRAADTLRVGNFVILADSAHAGLARGAAERVSPVLDTAYGAFATRLRSHLFVLRSRPPKTGESPDSAIVSGIVDDRGVLRLASDELPNADAVATSWRLKAAEVITQDLPREVREWVNEAIPAQPLAAKDLAVDRVDLVLWGSQAAHDCATGSNSRCLQALGLTPVADPAFDLFNEDQRHEMIERNANRFRRADPTQYSRCTNDHIQAICDSMAHAIPFDAVAAATPPGTRRSLLRYALKLGGAGSFDRLAAAEGTVAERIAAAANAPIDTVTRRWQQAVAQSGSTSTAIDFQTGASAVFWAAACCALALRSSRWR